MSKNTTMDLSGHTPKYGRRLDPGEYLVEVADFLFNPDAAKGQSIRFTFRCVDGSTFDGGTVGSTLYIINDAFSGSPGHKDATLDNWFHFLKAVGVKPGKFDAVKVAEKLVGRRLGIEVKESEPTAEGKVYSNVQAYFPAAALASTDASADSVDTPESDDSADGGLDLSDVA